MPFFGRDGCGRMASGSILGWTGAVSGRPLGACSVTSSIRPWPRTVDNRGVRRPVAILSAGGVCLGVVAFSRGLRRAPGSSCGIRSVSGSSCPFVPLKQRGARVLRSSPVPHIRITLFHVASDFLGETIGFAARSGGSASFFCAAVAGGKRLGIRF